jgi:hypothetical protein
MFKIPFREGAQDLVVDSHYDLRPGGKWSYEGVGPNNTPFHMEGKYLEVDPPRLLVQTRMADWVGEFETVVRWALEPREVHGLARQRYAPRGHGNLGKDPAFRICRPFRPSQEPSCRMELIPRLAAIFLGKRRNRGY